MPVFNFDRKRFVQRNTLLSRNDLDDPGSSARAFLSLPLRTSKQVGALVNRLRAGEPSTFYVAGDSTGNNSDEWPTRLAQWLGTKFPAMSVNHLTWNDTLQCVDPDPGANNVPFSLQVGSAGDGAVSGFSPTSSLFIPDSVATSIVGDLDVRAKVSTPDWNPQVVEQTICSKFGGAGQRSWRFVLQHAATAKLALDWTTDGTNLTGFRSSTVGLPFAAGQTGWVRFTLDVDNGAGGNTLTFYTSTNGITWTQLGAPVITAGISSLYDCTYQTEIGVRTGGSDAWLGSIYQVVIRNGINGTPVVALDMDTVPLIGTTFLDYCGNTVTLFGAAALVVSGSKALTVYNFSVAGQNIAYANDGTRFPKTTPVPCDLAFINYGHNEGSASLTYRAAYKQLADALVAKWPDTGVVAVTQNPKTPPETTANILAHALRTRQVTSLAAAQNWALIDMYAAVMASGQASAYVDSIDGIHPTLAGRDLWTARAISLFTPWI